jgi:phosphatidylglycerophosphate synthase
MSVYLLFCQPCPVPIWGRTSRERIERILGDAVRPCTADPLADLAADDTVLLFRGDNLYDDRLVSHLAATPNLLLQLDALPNPAVAAHVPATMAAEALALVDGAAADATLPGVERSTPNTITLAFQKKLRKSEPPFVLPITAQGRQALEQRLFDWSYKGVTDLVTKWAWPAPARRVVALAVRWRLTPNQVTLAGLVLVCIAGACFFTGHFAIGLAAGWLMTFLDTVDGKLARVTLTSSRFGHYFDHLIDLIHPPLWYLLWGLGLSAAQVQGLGLEPATCFRLIFAGYIAGRLVEGSFQLLLGRFSIFCWRPVDSWFRLITARRNPCLILLTASLLAGRPELGLLAVTGWTVASTLFLLGRLALAGRERLRRGEPLQSWLAEADEPPYAGTRAARIFAGR